MTKRTFLFISLTILTLSPAVYAQGSDSIFSQLESGSLSLRNPFESQLPRAEKPIVIEPVIVPEKIEPPKVAPTCADNIQLCTTQSDCIGNRYYWYGYKCHAEPEPPRVTAPIAAPAPPKIEKSLPKVSISGIIWNSDRPQAIINEKIVDIGDTILDIKITGIQKDGIEGLFEGKTVTLKP